MSSQKFKKFRTVSQSVSAFLLLARLMGQCCFARCRLSTSVVCRRRLYNVAGRVCGSAAAGRLGGPAANTARRASTVTSRYGDILFYKQSSEWDQACRSTVVTIRKVHSDPIAVHSHGRHNCFSNVSLLYWLLDLKDSMYPPPNLVNTYFSHGVTSSLAWFKLLPN